MNTIVVAEIVGAAFILVALISMLFTPRLEKSSKILTVNTGIVFLWLIIDITSYVTGLSYIPTLLTFSMGSVSLLCFTFYVEAYITERIKIGKYLFLAPKIISVLCIIISVVAFVTGKVVSYENGVATDIYGNPLLVEILQMVAMFYCPIIAITKGKAIGWKSVILMTLFLLAPLFGVIGYTMTGNDVTVVLCGVTLMFLVLCLEREHLREAFDKTSDALVHNDALYRMIDGYKWSYGINADGEVVTAQYDDGVRLRPDAVNTENPMAWVDSLHPEDKERALSEFMAAVNDLSGNTAYETVYRILSKDGEYIWAKTSGRLIPHADGTAELFGMSIDITAQMEEQQKRLLGAVPISPDILAEENIGMWSFELDEGQSPRMYGDDAMIKLVGLDHQVPPEEMYHAWYDHIDKDSYNLVNDAVEKMMAGEHAEVQYPWHHPDGHTMIVRCGGVRNFEYTDGIRVEGTHQNVTEVLHFDDEERKTIAETNTRLFALEDDFESMYDVNLETGEYEDFIKSHTYSEMVNTKFVERGEFFETSYQNIDTVAYPEDREGFKQAINPNNIKKELEVNSHFDYYYRLVVDDEPVWFRMRIVYKDEEKKNIIIGVFNAEGDVQAKQIAEQHELLKIARDAADAANKAKTDFLFNMSHDIRTPMNAITGFTTMAKKYSGEREKVEDYLDKIDTSGHQLLSLVNQVLEMARIESGHVEMSETPVNIRKEFNTMVTILGEQAVAKSIKFKHNLDVEHINVFADESRMNSITLNIVGNALKYTPEGGVVEFGLKEVSARKDGYATYILTVEDTGIGMSDEFQKRLFEPFSRENNSTVSKIQGTGLGMAIVKELVDFLEGDIEVHSEADKGTRFDVTVDFRINQDAVDESEPEYELDTVDFKSLKVLLVEDNELNREIAKDILEEEGFVVDEAEDGSVSVEILKEKGPDYYDFILMDIQMPFMNGYEATKAIREMYPDAKLPIIALSANAFEEDKQASLEAGMNDHVAKPIEIVELFGVLAKYL